MYTRKNIIKHPQKQQNPSKGYDQFNYGYENEQQHHQSYKSQNFCNGQEQFQYQQDQNWNDINKDDSKNQNKQSNKDDNEYDDEQQFSQLEAEHSQGYEQNQDNNEMDQEQEEEFPLKLPFSVTSTQLQKNSKSTFQGNKTNAYQLTFKKELNHFQNYKNNQRNNLTQAEEYHKSNQISMMNKKLFKSSKAQNQDQYELSQLPSDLQSLLTQPLQYFYKMPIESLQNLPFFQMESCILTQSQIIKKNIIGQVLQVKRLKIKLHSAQINHNILLQKKQKNIQQNHKEYLLSLLKLQLHKKLFIQCLRLNVLQNHLLKSQIQQKKQKMQVKHQSINKNKYENQKNIKIKVNELKQQQSDDQGHQNEYQNNLQDSFEIQQKKAKGTIFMQILHTIFSRKTYLTFHMLVDYRKNTSKLRIKQTDNTNDPSRKNHPNKNNLKNQESQKKVTPQKKDIHLDFKQKENQLQKYLAKRQQDKQNKQSVNYQRSSQYEQVSNYQHTQQSELQDQDNYNQQNSNQESLSDEQKMKELIILIQQLQQQLDNTNEDQVLKIYFLKWKIFYLNSILSEFQQNEEGQEQEQEEEQLDRKSLNQEEEQEEENSFSSIATSGIYSSIIQNTQGLTQKANPYFPDSSLKREKKYLKYFLFREHAFNFFDLFKEKVASDKLKKICRMLYEENLLKKALKGFQQNVDTKNNYQQMEAYYQNIAEQQIEDNTTYDMFHRTTIIARNFFNLKNTWKICKMLRLLDKTTLKISFIKIANFSNFQKKKQFNIERFIQISNSKQKFRAFQGWKQKILLDENVTKAKRFRKQKDLQIVKHYYSIFQLFYKKNLIQQKKAIKHYRHQNILKSFQYLKFLSMQNRELNQKSQELMDSLMFKKGRLFMKNITDYYTESLLYQRIKIKQRKLQTNLDKSFIIQRLKSWQTLTIKKQSYKAIQYRLIRLREKQVKGNILKMWYDQLLKAQQRKQEMDQSSQHKDWLVKYYGDLCSMVKL